MTQYCVELEPIEDYFFGNERSFGFGRDNKAIYNNYFITSENLPTQTTLLGMMRYFVLKRNNLLNKDFSSLSLSDNELKRQEELIGSGFRFDGEFDCGVIKEISPMFLKNRDDEILIKAPFNGKISDNKLELRKLKADNSEIKLIDGNLEKDFKLIEGIRLKEEDNIRNSYVILNESRKVIKNEDIFNTHIKVGINRFLEKDGFFKKEYKSLKDYKLCFYVTFNETKFKIPDNKRITDIVYMGMGKSAFKFTMYKETNCLEDKIESIMKADNMFYYALSDLACKDTKKLNECCDLIFLETRNFRCLKTNYQEKSFYNKLKQSGLYNLIRAGSVFFVNDVKKYEFEQLFENDNLKKAGFNQIIKIGGND